MRREVRARGVGTRVRPVSPRASPSPLVCLPPPPPTAPSPLPPPPLSSVCVYGGVPKREQVSALRAGAAMVVATPGRLEDLMNDGACR